MKFEFWTKNKHSYIRANFEKDDSYVGNRQEGAGSQIEYTGEVISFDYEVKNIHPDILGLICLLIFYPFIGKQVEFPMPVSSRLKEAFSNQNFKKQFEFVNIDDNLSIFTGSKMALSLGGGIDSSSVRAMFPEAFIVHEAHLRDKKIKKQKKTFWNKYFNFSKSVSTPTKELVLSDTNAIVKALGSEKGKLITSNQRYVSKPGGWHTWPCSTITSLLLATDMDFGIIFTGTNAGSSMLSNGDSFWDRLYARKFHGPSGNFWQSTFESIGIPLFSPIIGTSGFQAMALSMDLVRSNEVVSCMKKEGNACRSCTKCLRRDLIRTVVDQTYIPNWKAYDTTIIHDALTNRPLYFGHVHSYAVSKLDNLPSFISERLEGLPRIKTDWPIKFYEKTFELCPQEWREIIRERVLSFINPMNSDEIEEFKNWSQL